MVVKTQKYAETSVAGPYWIQKILELDSYSLRNNVAFISTRLCLLSVVSLVGNSFPYILKILLVESFCPLVRISVLFRICHIPRINVMWAEYCVHMLCKHTCTCVCMRVTGRGQCEVTQLLSTFLLGDRSLIKCAGHTNWVRLANKPEKSSCLCLSRKGIARV